MCPYCGDFMAARLISEDQGYDFEPGVAAYILDGYLQVEIEADDHYEFSAPVNYCPMCGGKLYHDK